MTDFSTLVLNVDGTGGIRQLDAYTKSAEKADRSSQLLSNALKTLAGALGVLTAIDAAKRVIALSDAYTGLTGRLAIATKESNNLAAAQARLFAIAQDSRQRLGDVAQLYTRLSIGAKELGASQQQLFQFTEGVGKALLVTGTSGAQASGALLQLSQAIGSGIVRAEEFNSILEGAPRILQAVAEGFGKSGTSVAALRQQVLAGKVTSQEFFQAFLKGSASIQEEARSIPATVSGAFTQLENSLLKYIGQSTNVRTVTSGIADVVLSLANHLGELAQAATLVGTVMGAKLLGSALEQLRQFSAAIVKSRAETVAYAEDALRTARANEAIALSEAKATAARLEDVAATQAALVAERALQTERLKSANRVLNNVGGLANATFEQQRAGSVLGSPQSNALGGAVIAREKAAYDAATRALNEHTAAQGAATAATAELSRLGTIQQGVIARETALNAEAAAVIARKTLATEAAAVAQRAFTASTSLLTAAAATTMTGLRGLLALVGGIPGLVAIAGYALYSFLTDTSKATEELQRRSEKTRIATDDYAKSLEGLSAKALEAAKAQEMLNLAQAVATSATAGAKYSAERADRMKTANRPGGLTGPTGEETRAFEEYTKALQQNEIIAGRVNLLTSSLADSKKRETRETQALTDEYKKQLSSMTISVERQRALNSAFGAAKDVIDAINAKFTLKAKIAEIDAQFTGKQAAELRGLAVALSDAEQKQAAFSASQSADRANEDRVRVAQQAFELVGMEAEKADILRVNQKAVNDAIAARRELSGASLKSTLDAIEAERTLGVRAVQTNAAIERRREITKKVTEELTDSIKLAVEAGAKAVQQGLDDMKRAQADGARALLEQAEKLKPVVDNFVRDFQSSISGGIDRMLNDGLKSWQSFFDSVKQMFTKLLSDIVASQLMQKAIAPLTGALFPAVARAQNPFAIQSSSSQSLLQGAGIGVAGLGLGYGIGSATGSRTAGILGGAATGAAAGAFLAAPTGGLSVVAGAAIGALTGAIGGLLGASKKGTQEIIAQRAAQEQLNAAMATLRASFSNDALGQQLAAVTAQFSQLRQQTEAAYAGKKNEADRNKALAELNELEAKRVQVIKDEYAAQQASIQQSQDIRQAIALGRVAQADALDFAKQQQEAYNALVKQGADAATLAKEAETQLLEARKRTADLAEAERRRIFDVTNDTRSISDPRGAAQAAFDEAQAQKYTDAVSRGASAAELAAIASNNLARAAQRAAEIMEADNRVTEGLMNRVFTALGDPRVAQDAAKFSSDRQELADAIKDSMTPSNLALLRFTQFVEREQVGMQRRIEDGTKAIQAAAAEQIKQKDSEIAAEQARVALSQKGFDDQIAAVKSGADEQIAALDEQRGVLEGILDGVRSQLQTAQEELRISERAYEALSSFANSLNLSAASTLSPTQKLVEAQAQFDLLARQAQAGNADSAANLPAAAQAFLEASRQVNASGTAYASDFARVKQITDALTSQYGGRLTAAQGTVATMEALVESTQKEIDRLDEIKAATKDAADATVTKLQALKEADKAASDALLEKLGIQKQAISDGVQAQIDALTKVETEAFNARIEASAYYADWKRLTEQQMLAADAFYRQFSEYLSPTSTVNGPMPVIIESGNSVPTSDPELKNVVAELKSLVESQQQQIDALRQQLKVSADSAQKTLTELKLVRGAVEGVSSAIKRAGEGAMIQ